MSQIQRRGRWGREGTQSGDMIPEDSTLRRSVASASSALVQIEASAWSAAVIVVSMSPSLWAREMKAASNWDGGR